MINVAPKLLIPHIVHFLLPLILSNSQACMFTVTNNCPYTIWPGTLAGAGTPQLGATGFELDPGNTVGIRVPPGWSGRVWARTGCTFDENGEGECGTGDCGGKMVCNGTGASPPATLFEITLGLGQDQDYYDVSLVDGYNLPLVARPSTKGCNNTGCAANLNTGCPKELQLVDGEAGVVACKSACEAFGLDEYCCSGEFGSAQTCRPSFYSTIFKTACPRAYSYAYDDGSSTFTCKAYDYSLTFCPTVSGIYGIRRSGGVLSAQSNGERSPGEEGGIPSSNSNSLFSHLPCFLFILLALAFYV